MKGGRKREAQWDQKHWGRGGMGQGGGKVTEEEEKEGGRRGGGRERRRRRRSISFSL